MRFIAPLTCVFLVIPEARMPVVSMDFLTHRSHRMDFDSVLAQDFLVRPNGADERYRQLADFFLPEPALAARDFRAPPFSGAFAL